MKIGDIKMVKMFKPSTGNYKALVELVHVGTMEGVMYETLLLIEGKDDNASVHYAYSTEVRDLTPAEATKYIKYIL